MWKFSSGVAYRLLPTPQEEFFLPRYPPLLDKCLLILFEAPEVPDLYPGILPHHSDHPVISIFDSDGDETFFLERADVGANLAFADIKELGEVAVGGVATAFVVQGMNFDKEHFFHNGNLVGEPNLFGNPDAFEIAGWSLHWPIIT